MSPAKLAQQVNRAKSISKGAAFLALFFLAGCALEPASVERPIQTLEPVDTGEITVVNLAPNISDLQTEVFTGDFLAMPSDFTKPPFPVLVARRLRATLSAEGTGPSLRVSLLRADLQVKSRVADDIPFVGFGSLLFDRPHRCRVEALIEVGDEGRRETFESVYDLPNHWIDTSLEKRNTFVDKCLKDISRQVRLALLEAAKK